MLHRRFALPAATLALLLVAVGCGCASRRDEGKARNAPPASSGPRPVIADTGKRYVKPSDAALQEQLTPLQYEVTQNAATEPPFQNTYWNHHEVGLYVDITTGEPLFASVDKFDSGTGWPSFTRPVDPSRVVSHPDTTHGMVRVEVRSKAGNAHLGHVFDDGPEPTGQRYCINSASLRFVPLEKLASEGYGEYLALFQGAQKPPEAASDNSCTRPQAGAAPGCNSELEIAVLGGDCAWAGEQKIRRLPGVLELELGWDGSGDARRAALRVVFDPKKISYAELVDYWLERADAPVMSGPKSADKARRLVSTVYATNETQRTAAEARGKRYDESARSPAAQRTAVVARSSFASAALERGKHAADGAECALAP